MFEGQSAFREAPLTGPSPGADTKVGAAQAAAYCPPPHNVVIGIRVTGVTAGTAITVGISVMRRAEIICVSMPESLGQIWFFTSFKVIDTELIIGTQPTSSSGTATAGCFGSEFVAYSRCANALEGLELDNNSPITMGATNTSSATQEFRITILLKPIAQLSGQ